MKKDKMLIIIFTLFVLIFMGLTGCIDIGDTVEFEIEETYIDEDDVLHICASAHSWEQFQDDIYFFNPFFQLCIKYTNEYYGDYKHSIANISCEHVSINSEEKEEVMFWGNISIENLSCTGPKYYFKAQAWYQYDRDLTNTDTGGLIISPTTLYVNTETKEISIVENSELNENNIEALTKIISKNPKLYEIVLKK